MAGLVAAAMGLAVGELVGGLITSAGSPVVAVGGYVIDNVPPGAKDFAIETFGRNDKKALIVGTLVILAIIGMALGPLARRRPKVAAGIVAAVALAGILATRSENDVSLLVAVWPSLLGALAAVGTLVLLIDPPAGARPGRTDQGRRPQRADGAPRDGAGDDDGRPVPAALRDMPARRQFLISAGTTIILAGAVAGTGRFLAGRNSAAASRGSWCSRSRSTPCPRSRRRSPSTRPAWPPSRPRTATSTGSTSTSSCPR